MSRNQEFSDAATGARLPDPSGEFGPEHAGLISWWEGVQGGRNLGRREIEADERYGVSSLRATQAVMALVDRPEAVSYNGGEVAPAVNRIRRERDRKAQARSGRHLAQ